MGSRLVYNIGMEQTFHAELQRMAVELSELFGAGWSMRLIPRGDLVFMGTQVDVVFYRADPKEAMEILPHEVSINRFALPSELPRIIHDFYLAVFPIPRDGLYS